jgi:hypothetical protein
MVAAALAIALILERRKSDALLVAAHNLESAYERVCTFAVTQEGWTIKTTNGHMEVSGAGRPSYSALDATWNYPERTGKLHPFEMTWSKAMFGK